MTDAKDVFVITKRGERSFWTKVGTAFVNRDGSLNVKLEALPVNGELQIRDRKPRDEQRSQGGQDDDFGF